MTDSVPRLAPAELQEWLAAHPDAVLLDVRTPAEFAEGHVDGARNVDYNAPDFRDRAAELAPDVPYVVYCRSGTRSGNAGRVMRELGIADVVNGGGFEEMVRGGFPPAR